MRALPASFGALALLTAIVALPPSHARGEETNGEATATPESPRTRARSVGWVWAGLLQRGAHLDASPHVRHVARFRVADRFWGTTELVAALAHAGGHVASRHPGARLAIGEISQRGGGNVPGHRSHENGRDADVGFYLVDAEGNPAEADAFVHINGSGRGFDGSRTVEFDSARNWALLEALLRQTDAPVQAIFVAAHVRLRLLRYARGRRADRDLIDRADRTLLPPEGVARHDDHFHVRVYCDPGDREVCLDRGAYWAWLPPAHIPAGALVVPPGYGAESQSARTVD